MLSLIQKLRSYEPGRFLLVGCASTAIDFSIYMFLGFFLPVHISKLFSMCVSCLFSFVVNKMWTFLDNSKTDINQVVKYALVQCVNIATNVGSNSYLYSTLNAPKVVAFAVATCVAMVVNFMLQKLIVFHKRSRSAGDGEGKQ